MEIVVKKGLDIPIAGKPEGSVQKLPSPQHVSLNLSSFDDIHFKLLKKEGDSVQRGEPLLENKAIPGLLFVSPGGGKITAIRRGAKRQLLDIVISLSEKEEIYRDKGLSLHTSSREEIINYLMARGIFPHIRRRPFCLIANPQTPPRDIFVQAITSLPFAPKAEMQVAGEEKYFQIGLDTLQALTKGKVHLVYAKHSPCKAFSEAKNVETHPASGPHPIENPSIHIHQIAPLRGHEDCVWTLTVVDVITIGKMMAEGSYYVKRILSIAGEGIAPQHRGFFEARIGFPIKELAKGKTSASPLCFISGSPLLGSKVEEEDFLHFPSHIFSSLSQNTNREALHFLRFGWKKYSATRTYASGHLSSSNREYSFSTNQHGEERPFIDAAIYDKVMPLPVPTMLLVKAVLAEDYELAELLGLCEVAREDFALPSFICPSKIDMMEIVKRGLQSYSKELGH